jgi:hypothetical protein
MKPLFLVLFFSLFFLSCNKNNTIVDPGTAKTISTSLYSTDTSGIATSVFFYGKPFCLVYKLTNTTGKNQPYYWTGPISEIIIFKGDSIVAAQYANARWSGFTYYDTLKADTTITNLWKLDSSNLPEGIYTVKALNYLQFDNVEIEQAKTFTLTIGYGNVVEYKPNIYLYPQKPCSVDVKIHFPQGGSVIKSKPTYGNGWNVFAEPSGKINHQYNYLFYEAENPDAYQYQSGWSVARDTLASFFTNTLTQSGFNQKEITDFTDYWIPLLQDSKFYTIYPQWNSDITKMIGLSITPAPDHLLRLFFVIKKADVLEARLSKPAIPQFVRQGYVGTEWGVVLK